LRLPELAPLKHLQFMVAFRQRKWCPKGITVTKSPLQLLTDAVTRTQATGLSMN
jgi:hypothetical protein